MVVLRRYRSPALSPGAQETTLDKLKLCGEDNYKVEHLDTELCFYIQLEEHCDGLQDKEEDQLSWILSTPFQDPVANCSKFETNSESKLLIDIGPRLNFSTPLSTNAVSICHSVGLKQISRIEVSTRYLIVFNTQSSDCGDGFRGISKKVEERMVGVLHDKMTQCRYLEPIKSFDLNIKPEAVYDVDVMGQGRTALEKVNKDLGLAFDEWDLNYYTELFQEKVKRNPTSVECFDLAQSNSEHSRHWFFKGRMVVDGTEHEDSLFKMVMGTQEHSNQNNIIKFNDNSSGIQGFNINRLYPSNPAKPNPFMLEKDSTRDIIFTAETHNFPTGVAPFPGATTGTGGRIRDVHCTGRGAHVIAGTAGYCFGNLNIPGYKLPWEDETFQYPQNFAPPLEIAIEASNGASDYGNKFGEPVLTGFARSCGLTLPNGERREWVKPIMFSGGIGSLERGHVKKQEPEKGMDIVKIGGPVYRIGVGGGAASSIQVQGDNISELDFGAVQRGDAEMEQKLNRVIRACIEQGENNPICSIHDQGAGGNGNVLKEICEPAGALIHAGQFQLGDPTLSILELWGAEYQETNALLADPRDASVLTKIGLRERCSVSFVGKITGDGKIKLVDDRESRVANGEPEIKKPCVQNPVDLELEHVLGSMPRKVFKLDHKALPLEPLALPEGITVKDALMRVLRLPAVASKRYLTNKVDRSVTGLVAQQQCVGPLHTPLADVAVVALSHFDTVGGATAIGEQPIKGLVDAGCGARMSVGEALTNLVFAQITDLRDVKCSGNWMWAAKLPGEGALLFDACVAMCDVMKQLGVAIDGGKDSLSMAARVGTETVKAPGALVVSAYVGCPDITATVTPDLKCPEGKGILLYVPLCHGKHRLGGSALAQCYGQVGDQAPDLEDAALFTRAFNVTQQLIQERMLEAGHDVSDGGLITCILEMAFAGNCGVEVDIAKIAETEKDFLKVLFAEELGWVLEVKPANQEKVLNAYKSQNVTCLLIGSSAGYGSEAMIKLGMNDPTLLTEHMSTLRDTWEELSFQMEYRQTNPHCVDQEKTGLKHRRAPPYSMTFDPDAMVKTDVISNGIASAKPTVAVIREEGSNGDREMVAGFHMAGFEVWDVNMQDVCTGAVTMDRFRGAVFVGGFSYADVMGSAKGWAASLRFNKAACAMFDNFYSRRDTFSLGVCNGCQLMALLGKVGEDQGKVGVHLAHNKSERFESRFVTVKIQKSPAMMLQGMEGSVLGIWVAHGEGRMVFKTDQIYNDLKTNDLIPVTYVDDEGNPTEEYPLNPNGSRDGVAALCSPDGRHLAMMPHPERCVLPWQWPWMPEGWHGTMKTSPWMGMFKNAFKWCQQNDD